MSHAGRRRPGGHHPHQGMNFREAQELARRNHVMRGLTDMQGAEDDELFDDLFFYPFSFGNLAAGANFPATIQIQADSHFEWMRSTCFGYLNGATEPYSSSILLPINIFLTDTGSARQLMSVAMPMNLLAGKGDLPFINPVGRYFNPSSTVQATATNFGASQYNQIWFAMIGRKVFREKGRR